ncbi:MAG: hypothetical protein ACTSRP_09320 [Candidatus Helarchaeota archaeon]
MKEKRHYSGKGLALGVIVSILLMFTIALNINLLLIFSIVLSILSFSIAGEKDGQILRKNKFYIFSYTIIAILILSIIISNKIALDSHEGNVYKDVSKSPYYSGSLTPYDNLDKKYFDFPDGKYYYNIRTNMSEPLNLTAKIELFGIKYEDIKSSTALLFYFYEDYNNIKLGEMVNFTLKQADDQNLIGNVFFNFYTEKHSHHYINYIIKFLIEVNDPLKIKKIYSIIEFNSSLNNLEYGYFEGSRAIPEGALTSGMEVLVAPPILYNYAFVLLFAYLFIVVLCFIFQRFNLAKFMVVIYILIGFILLFWYVSWGIENPERMGLGFPWTTSWDFSWLDPNTWINSFTNWISNWLDDNPDEDYAIENNNASVLNMEWLRAIMLTIIAILQWTFSIGIVLIIMIQITAAFNNIFSVDMVGSQLQIKELIKELGGVKK